MAEYINTEKHPFNFYVSTLESKVSNTIYIMSTFRDINAVRIEFYSERNLSWVVAHTKNAGRAGAMVDDEGRGWVPPPIPGLGAAGQCRPVSRHREQATESSLEAGKVDRCML